METAWLNGTDAQPVSDAVTRVLARRQAIVDEHTATHVVFEGLELDLHRFERGGVVTLVQPTLEKEVEVRVRVRSRPTSRLFWWTVGIELALALALFVLAPSGSTWFAAGVALWVVFIAVGLVHLGTVPASRAAERELLAEILAEAGGVAGEVQTFEDRVRAQASEEIEAEALSRQLKSGSR